MGLLDRWDTETWVCAVKGHVTPAAEVAVLAPEDAGLGLDVDSTWRLARCLRCDAWISTTPPDSPSRERLPPLAELELPRRGKRLRDAIILRLIAIERGLHSVIFTLVAFLGLLVRADLAGIQSGVRRFLDTLTKSEAQTGRVTNHGILVREGTKILHLRTGTLNVLIITGAVYAVIEGIEAVGLWLEKRWAEYLTALATTGFLPFEIYELTKRVTVLRVGALLVNLAILIYLVYAKRLFGIRRDGRADPDERLDPAAHFSRPAVKKTSRPDRAIP
ncbi:MAG TPA: DUF2127 domain-containing protein [Acidimicrobiales bacterium]|nr:DUF2127 domain-containing protein [Acidimicrobiales bacterium]